MTKKTIGTIIVLASLPLVVLARQNGLSPDKLQKANSEKAVSAAADISFSLFARDRATASEASRDLQTEQTTKGFSSVDKPQSLRAELSYANRSSDIGFSTSSESEASRDLQTERTTTGISSVDKPQSLRAELSYANRSSDVGFSTGSDSKARQELGEFGHNISRAPASDQ
jgi:hypothetical protein